MSNNSTHYLAGYLAKNASAGSVLGGTLGSYAGYLASGNIPDSFYDVARNSALLQPVSTPALARGAATVGAGVLGSYVGHKLMGSKGGSKLRLLLGTGGAIGSGAMLGELTERVLERRRVAPELDGIEEPPAPDPMSHWDVRVRQNYQKQAPWMEVDEPIDSVTRRGAYSAAAQRKPITFIRNRAPDRSFEAIGKDVAAINAAADRGKTIGNIAGQLGGGATGLGTAAAVARYVTKKNGANAGAVKSPGGLTAMAALVIGSYLLGGKVGEGAGARIGGGEALYDITKRALRDR